MTTPTYEELVAFVRLAKRLHDEALPKFDWGRSALDANAISLLNESGLQVDRLVARMNNAEPEPTPRMLITMDGGLIQNIEFDQPVKLDVCIADMDITDANSADYQSWEVNGNVQHGFLSSWWVQASGETNPLSRSTAHFGPIWKALDSEDT